MNLTPSIAKSTDPAIRVRMPEEMHRHIRIEAAKNGRSIATEVLFRIYESVQREFAQAGAQDQ